MRKAQNKGKLDNEPAFQGWILSPKKAAVLLSSLQGPVTCHGAGCWSLLFRPLLHLVVAHGRLFPLPLIFVQSTVLRGIIKVEGINKARRSA